MLLHRKRFPSARKMAMDVAVALAAIGIVVGSSAAASAGAGNFPSVSASSGSSGVIDEGPVSATSGVPSSKLAAFRNLNAQHNSPGPSSSIQPAYSAGARTLSVLVQPQATTYYCVPASSFVTLSAFLTYVPTQDTLAGQLGTTSNGTYMSNAPAVLNSYQTRNFYTYNSTTNLTDFRDRIQLDIQTYTAPLQNEVQMSLLPWYAGSISGHHDIATYGYDYSTKVSDAYVYDPWNDPRSGRKTIYTSDPYNAGSPYGGNLGW